MKAYASDRTEEHRTSEPLADEERPKTPEQVEEKLKAFGLDPFEVDLIMLRILDGKRMKEIVALQGWLSLNSAAYYLKRALKKLRAGGFKFP